MGLIQRLPEALANKIAAGEVVQRPSSVVKELVENAIDAGATEIAVTVKNAGKTLIHIRDNGSGMSPEDARLAFERHATSKITTSDDLDRIMTLGFRGEALAAISSVAQVELKTRREEDELGTLIRLENGAIIEESRTACDKGTSIAIRNLFFTVPARRKFLKSNATEFKHLVETMQAFALSYPAISFAFSDDDQLIFSVERGTLDDRVRSIYSQEMLNALLPFEAEGEGVRVHGYIGKPNFARRSKADQYLFMNGRTIASKLLSHGVFSGYEHLLDKQDYPPYILFLTIDPERVDVNVHPAKSEVKFDDENAIYRLLQEETRTTLSRHNLTPGMRLPDGDTGEGLLAALRYALPTYDRPETFPERRERSGESSAADTDRAMPRNVERTAQPPNGELFRSLFIDPYEQVPPPTDGDRVAPSGGDQIEGLFPIEEARVEGPGIPQQVRSVSEDDGERVGMWQVHNKYIITQIRSGIMIVDQHVAHERILYEQALRAMETSLPISQQLLFPLELSLSPSEFALVRELRGDLAALGFDISLESDRLTIQGVPTDVRAGQEESILRELLDQYHEYQTMGKTDQRDMLAASFACRASIKAGDPLSEGEMLSLIETLFSTTMPYVCPHGRPIVIRIDLGELDRRFGRTS